MPRIRHPIAVSDGPSVTRPRPIKRADSLASLPTPPRTATKRKRARSRVTDSDSEEDELPVPRVDNACPSDTEDSAQRDANGALVLGNKKRRTLDAIAEELSESKAEEEFWMGPSTTAASRDLKDASQTESKSQRARSRTRSLSASPPPAPHLLRRQHTGLASPPPSRRQPKLRPSVRLRTPPPRPATRSQKPQLFPIRDSPDNPFILGEPSQSQSPVDDEDELPEPRTPRRHVEKPTMTWVFRGTKVELANPHYKSPGAPPDESDTEASSMLPVTHPAYSPPPTYAPRMLFPEARRDLRRRAPRETRSEPTEIQAAVLDDDAPKTPPRPIRPLPRTRPQSRAVSAGSDNEAVEGTLTSRRHEPLIKPSAEDVEAAMQAAMAQRLAKRLAATSSRGSISMDEVLKTHTRAHGAPRLPEKDGDPVRRAMGPVRAGDEAREA
ncbi:uncharacterized protein FIBRA_08232 [Fibroporia radiculosa]|uniref:Uncharacterized protein n=1 Tax=Fibroporia radiculosa TaxID=599839 RepID=J4IC89_9APHY|nr:uncharacterized protein FIBRA_08232 [Fibroporia radiculosa]CCM05991.1 predicted protein [Fibroporia radiculosa]